MFISKDKKLTFSHHFLEPSESNHRQYEALRAYFVEGLRSAEAAARFGYTSGSFRSLVHQFRQNPQRSFFVPSQAESQHARRQQDSRQRVVALRKQNLSIYDISQALRHEGLALSPVAIDNILKQEGFARLPPPPRPGTAARYTPYQRRCRRRSRLGSYAPTVPHQVRRPVFVS